MGKEFSVAELQELMKSVSEYGIGELRLEHEGVKLRIQNHASQPIYLAPGQATEHPMMIPTYAPTPAPVASERPDITTIEPGEGKCVTSPLVGTFYSASAPDKPPFVKVGQAFAKGDVLFIVESMKVMNEVLAETDGVVADVMVSNGQAVEYSQPILRLE